MQSAQWAWEISYLVLIIPNTNMQAVYLLVRDHIHILQAYLSSTLLTVIVTNHREKHEAGHIMYCVTHEFEVKRGNVRLG